MENQSVDTSPPATQVKKENEEEIKEFAETAMNELLGWYGYERLELRKWAASRAKGTSSPDQNQEQRSQDECSWCNKNITSENGALQQAGATFCSELCFSQSRRANFKRAKTCDWCRHVRHTVAYVDFQDGATQLQFCSDKCLNQYKMHIFCRETQAHLDLNPHLVNASSNSNLITPDLWLKNCKSRSPSPSSERSKSPITDTNKPQLSDKMEPTKPQARKSPLPVITIAPTAKLMKQKAQTDERVTLQKSPETKKDFKNKMNLRKRRTSKCSSTVTSQTVRHSSTPKAQDLRMHSPSLDGSSPTSTIGSSAIHSPPQHIPQPLHPPPFSNPGFPVPPGINPAFLEGFHPHPRLANEQRHPLFPPRFNFMPRPGMQMPQERPGIQMHQERPGIPPPNFPPLLNQAPPVTVLVPYPVILPVPIPIPIPIPLSSFLQAHLSSKVKNETKNDDVEGPLDFTMNSNKKKDGESTVSDPAESAMVEERIVFHERADSPKERLEEREMANSESIETSNLEHTLPKFKITRIGNKMAKILPKSREPSESSRPLRKRRRLVDVATEDDALIPKTRKVLEV